MVAGVPDAQRANGSALTEKQQHDPVQWMRLYWEQQNREDPGAFLVMTSVLRLHHLMTNALEHNLRTKFKISLTDYQILTALQLSETGTWLLSRMAWHLMVHATTVTLAVERLETKRHVTRHSHPHDKRTTLVTITDEGRQLADAATDALARMDFGLPGLTAPQARSLIATIGRLRAGAGDVDRSYESASTDLA
jgi:DNA-binding MarR family transcriptional regulator